MEASSSAVRVSLNPPTGGGGASLAADAKALAAEGRRRTVK